MRKSFAVSLAVLTVLSIPTFAFALPVRPPAPDVALCAQGHPQHIHQVNDRVIRGDFEVLEGRAARAHLNNLKAKRAKLLSEAARLMHARGFKPTDQVVVTRNTSLAKSRVARPDSIMRVQDSYADGSGEIVFWSWDDGANETWEGVIYVEDYNSGAYATWESQVDVSTEEHYPVWEEYVGGGGGGTGPGDEPVLMTRSLLDHYSNAPKIASNALEYAIERLDPSLSRMGVRIGLRSWLGCTAAGCAGAATACILSGPGWPKCTLAWCAGSAVGCGVAELLR